MKFLIIIYFTIISSHIFPQSDSFKVSNFESDTLRTLIPETDSIKTTEKIFYHKVIPGAEYAAGSLHQFFLGRHWRDLWTTTIEVPDISLNKFAGGLTPLKKGGGLQTKSLRLIGKDGNEYKFRLIEKNPVSSLPADLQKSIYADIIRDQVSIGIPVSPLIVYPLTKQAGILTVKPELVYMPDTDELGIFKKDFGGKAGIIEINPRAGKKGINNFAGADKIVNGFDIFTMTEKDNDERVDAEEFLKARLLDILIGDRDRHSDQWQWAGYKSNGKRIWKPIPRDRDYSFAKYDGIFPTVSGLIEHSLVGYDESYPSILELTWSGRFLDRRFLNSLDKTKWDSVALNFQKLITDKVIEDAVSQLPPSMFKKEGKYLIRSLKKRRDNLKNASDEFFRIYSAVVDVYGSNKKEIAEVKILNDKELALSLFKKDKDTGMKKGNPFYKRIFNSKQTNEIRLYLLEDDDVIFVSGKKNNDILLRIIPGNGNDELINKSDLKIKIYDDGKETKIKTAEDIYYNDDKINVPQKITDKYEPLPEDRYGFWAFTPVLSYDTDNGYIFGGGPNFTKFGFRANPYLYYLEFTGAYATSAKDYDIRFHGNFYKLIHNSRVQISVKASELDFNRFYGYGNETVRIDSLADNKFYRTNQKDFSFEPKVYVKILKDFYLNFSTLLRYANVAINQQELVGLLNPYGTGKIFTAGLGAGFSYEIIDNLAFPKKGWRTNFNTAYFPKILNNKSNFGKFTFEILNYSSYKFLTLALRASGELLVGEHPYYYGAFLGGLKNLRGYPRERFLGEGVISGQSELRCYITTINLFIPARIGVSALSDVGRVFLKSEDSKRWHSTYGFGLWLNILNSFTLNFNVAVSPEVTKYYFNTGFTL